MSGTKQIVQYTSATAVASTDNFLLQQGAVGTNFTYANLGKLNALYVSLNGGTIAGTVVFSSGGITGLPTPLNPTDATSKTYVDTSRKLSNDADVGLSSPVTGDRLHYNGSVWVNGREPYIVTAYQPGVMSNNETLLFHVYSEQVKYQVNFATSTSGAASTASALANATASTTLTVQKAVSGADPTSAGSWSSIGTIIYALSGHSGALTLAGGATFNQGDMMKINGPATADATLAGVAIILGGDR